MSLCIGRISYLPDEPKRREVRLKESQRAYEWLYALKPETSRMRIVVQNYTKAELALLGEQQATIFETPVGVAKARNVLLELFYRSNDDYMLIADDDASLYDYYAVGDLLNELHNVPHKFIDKGIHIIKAIEPQYTPFKQVNARLPLNDMWCFCQAPMGNGGGLFIIANLKKHCGIELYFDEALPVQAGGEREDIDFFIRAIKRGISVLECRAMVQRNYCNDGGKSTVFTGEQDINQTANQAMRNTAARHGIPIMNNRVQFAKALPLFKGHINIAREKRWEGTQDVKTVKKRPKGRLI